MNTGSKLLAQNIWQNSIQQYVKRGLKTYSNYEKLL
jgi:hypothetical protein